MPMRKLLFIFLVQIICTCLCAQHFEGVLKIDYTEESGKKNAVDVYAKGDKFFIKKIYGGCDRYDAYIYDTGLHTLCCLSAQNPKVSLRLNIDQILQIYDDKHLKPGYKIHQVQTYTTTGATKPIVNNMTIQKKAIEQNVKYEIWVSDLKINYGYLIPVLRVLGFWDATEDGDSAILETQVTNLHTKKVSTITATPYKIKVEDRMFVIPDQYQQVDMDKFLANENKSPRFGDLVKAFAGF